MCATTYQIVHDFAGPVATFVAAGAAVFVTWRLGRGQLCIAHQQADVARQQAQLADVRLQHDLFERRIAVFDATRDLVLEVFHSRSVSDDIMNAFMRGTEKSVFLFDQTINDYIVELRNRASALGFVVRGTLADSSLPHSSEWKEYARIRDEHLAWFQKQFDVLIPRFKPALALDRNTAMKLPEPI